jgi:phosphonate transport system substrate-binding protein
MVLKRRYLCPATILVLSAILSIPSCSRPTYQQVSLTGLSQAYPTPTLTVGMPPLRVAVAAMLSPQTTTRDYDRLIAYLENRLDRPVELVQRSTYAETNELLRTRQVDLAFVCTGAYVRGERDFGMELLTVPQVRGEITYRSYLIVPADSPAGGLEDLRERVFAFTDPLSLSGYMAPVYLLRSNGASPDDFFARTLFTYSHDNSIQAVAEGWADGAAVDSLVYDALVGQNPFYGETTRVIWRSQPYGAPPAVVHPDLDADMRERLRSLLLRMDKEEEGAEALAALGADSFVLADDHLYDSARAVLDAVGDLE